jgi:lysine 2,3-aminomutase
MRQMRGRFSGLCQPTYMLDIPDGAGKVPIGPSYVAATGAGAELDYEVRAINGGSHPYPPRK